MATVKQVVAGGAVTAISRWTFNCYVVHDGGAGSPVVIDPGIPSNGVTARSELERLGGSVPAATVVCTHGHADHVAGLGALRGADALSYHLPAACESWIRAGTDPTPSIEQPDVREVVKIAPVLASQSFDLGALRELAPLASAVGTQTDGLRLPFAPAGFLADGDEVPGAPGWEVLSTPGHTADSTCYYHRDSATLLSGDSVLTHEGRAWINPEHLLAEDSASTEERLRELPVEHLLPGHGLPVSGTDLLGRARSFREQPTGRSISCRLSRLLGRW